MNEISTDYTIINSCLRKEKYANLSVANLQLAAYKASPRFRKREYNNGVKLKPYHCKICGFYHLGHKAKKGVNNG